MTAFYEPPAVTYLGTVAELTQQGAKTVGAADGSTFLGLNIGSKRPRHLSSMRGHAAGARGHENAEDPMPEGDAPLARLDTVAPWMTPRFS